MAKFADALKKFELINSQSSDTKLTRIWELLATLLLHIPYDKTEVTHIPISLIRRMTAYTTRYGAEFDKPACVGAYDATIDDNATAVVRARTEAAHKAKRANRGTHETARRKTTQFILAVIEATWLQELRDPGKSYTDITPKELLSHLQAGCAG